MTVRASHPWKRRRVLEDWYLVNDERVTKFYREFKESLEDDSIDDEKPYEPANIQARKAMLAASKSIVGILTFLDDRLCEWSGTIIDFDQSKRTAVLTCAAIFGSDHNKAEDIEVGFYFFGGAYSNEWVDVAVDPHWNIAVLEVHVSFPVVVAKWRSIKDHASISSDDMDHDDHKFEIQQHRPSYSQLLPADPILCIGRSSTEPFDLQISVGRLSADICNLDCKELLRASCVNFFVAIGGAVINKYRELIGMPFYCEDYTPFLPINIIMKWWEQYKIARKYFRPSIGMRLLNLYAQQTKINDRTVSKFRDFSTGVVIGEVDPGSKAREAGLRPNDVVIKCNGQPVLGVFQLALSPMNKNISIGL